MQDIEKIPFFFIIGRPRSGTTLLKSLFDAHPNIIIPNEFPVIIDLYNKYGKITKWNLKQLEDFYNDVFKVRKIEYNKIDKEKLYADLMSCVGNTNYQNIIKTLYLSLRSEFPKYEILLFGDKDPLYSMYIIELLKIFPEAKYIHIVRDYRDQVLSMIKKELYDVPSVSIFAYQWKRSLKMMNKMKEKYPEKFITIKYEEFIQQPKPALKNICKFLNIPFDENVFNYHNKKGLYSDLDSDGRLSKIQDNILNPINTKRLNAWKTELNKKSIKIADITVGKYAEMYGYERVYKNKLSFYFFPIFIIKAYSLFQFFLRKQINKLPLEKRYKLMFRKSFLLKIYYSLFKNI